MDDKNFPINKISDQIKNFNDCNHKFIQDPKFNNTNFIESMFSSIEPDTEPQKPNEQTLFESMKQTKKEIKDERFNEKLIKDAFKYLYYSQKMKHVPEFKEHRRKLEEIDHNIRILSMMGTLYTIYMIFKKIDLRMTYYDRIDDIIKDKPRKLNLINKPFHFSMILTSFSLLFWNISKSKRLEKEYQDKLRQNYLKNLSVSKKHPQNLISM